MTWRTKSGEPVFRKSPDAAWPLRRVDEQPEREDAVVVPIKRKGGG